MNFSSLPLTLLILLAIITKTTSSSSSDSKNSYFIDGTSCMLIYDTPSSTFTFLECKIKGQSTINSWQICFDRCCPIMPQGDYSIATLTALQDCQLYNPTNQSRVLFVIIIFMILIFGGVVLCCLCLVIWRIVRHFSIQKIKVGNNMYDPVVDVEWTNETEINVAMSSNLKWSQKSTPSQRLQNIDETCSICLDEQPTAELICRHKFHPRCISTWFRKSTACPFCRRQNIRGIKVYCQKCKWKYMVITRTVLMVGEEGIPVACKECENRELVRAESIQELRELEGSQMIINGDISKEKMRSKVSFEDERMDD